MSRWLIVGSGPSVKGTLPAALVSIPKADVILTSNAGIKLLTPHVYICCDAVASVRFYEPALWAQQNGTKLVTLNRHPDALKSRQVDHYDEFLHEPDWLPFRFTGPLCLEYALRNGATSVVLVGFDGYALGVSQYFDGSKGDDIAADKRNRTIAAELQQRAGIWPGVPIIQVGPTHYNIRETNWNLIE